MKNRELKFRAWIDNKMEYSIGVSDYGVFYRSGVRKTTEVPIMQFTGFVDINKKDIYEGDIISYSFNDGEPPMIGVVEFFAGMFIVSWNDQTDQELAYMRIDGMEVVGNIFENQNLLK